MREFKFRVWQKDVLDNPPYMVHPGHVADWQVKELNEGGAIDVMQYTGVKDMDGVEIYEHDILEIVDLQTGKNRRRRVVTYNPNSFRYNGIPLTHNYRVIGNTHDID